MQAASPGSLFAVGWCLVRWLLQDDTGLLVTILIGNNLMIELLTHLTEHEIEAVPWVPDAARELVVETMGGAMTLEVPLVVDTGTGRTWLEAH